MNSNTKNIIASKFTELMIEKMETVSASDWKKGWFNFSKPYMPPCNLSGSYYRGSNRLMLSLYSEIAGYKTNVFTTFKGGEKFEVYPKKGAKGFPILYWNIRYSEIENPQKYISREKYLSLKDEEQALYKSKPILQSFVVFNIDQTNFPEKYPDRYNKYLSELKSTTFVQNDFSYPAIDQMLKAQKWYCPISLSVEEKEAYYSASDNEIHLPAKEKFFTGENFYATLLHEMAHSTGHKDLLNRKMGGYLNPEIYAKEELVAELTAAITCRELNITSEVREDNAQYLKYWLQELKKSPSYLFDILLDVGKSSDLIIDRIFDKSLYLENENAMEEASLEAEPLREKEGINIGCTLFPEPSSEYLISFTASESTLSVEEVASALANKGVSFSDSFSNSIERNYQTKVFSRPYLKYVPKEKLFLSELLVPINPTSFYLKVKDGLVNDFILGFDPLYPSSEEHLEKISFNDFIQNQDKVFSQQSVIGSISWYDFKGQISESQEFYSSDSFLQTIKENLEYNPSGFRYKVLLEDPHLRKSVDDLVYDFYGMENSRSVHNYDKQNFDCKEYGFFSNWDITYKKEEKGVTVTCLSGGNKKDFYFENEKKLKLIARDCQSKIDSLKENLVRDYFKTEDITAIYDIKIFKLKDGLNYGINFLKDNIRSTTKQLSKSDIDKYYASILSVYEDFVSALSNENKSIERKFTSSLNQSQSSELSLSLNL